MGSAEGIMNSATRSAESNSSDKVEGAYQPASICQTCPQWRYQVGARRIGAVAGYEYHHLFVVASDRRRLGADATYSAFPSYQSAQPRMGQVVSGAILSDSAKSIKENHRHTGEASDYGTVLFRFRPDYLRSGEYLPGNLFVTLKETNEDYNPKLLQGSTIIDNKAIKYEPAGPNSNSFAMSIVRYAGLPRKKPSVNAPGDGMYLL